MTARRRQVVDAREPDGSAADDPVWRRLREIVSLLNASPIIQGRLITEEEGARAGSGIALTTGEVRAIPHKLGRPALGFFEVCSTGLPASGGCAVTAAAFPPGTTSEHYIAVRADNTGRTFLWVF